VPKIAGKNIVVWWKIPSLLLTTKQMQDVGLIGPKHQLTLWL